MQKIFKLKSSVDDLVHFLELSIEELWLIPQNDTFP